MNRVNYIAVFLLLMVMSRPVSAAGSTCSFSKSVRVPGITFDISSRAADGCGIQIVKVDVRQRGKRIAGLKADVDYLARSARTVDLNGDGKQELAVFSRTAEVTATEALDIYWLDGKTLRRAMVPEPGDKAGYKGGDRFVLKGRQIVRVIPVYRDGDPAGKPTGGTRSLKYEFRDGAITPLVQAVMAPGTANGPKAQVAVLPVQTAQPVQSVLPVQPPVAAKPAVPAPAVLAVSGVKAVKAGIEISSCGPIAKFKVMKLEKPERIAIDIPDADSPLAGRKITINRFNITKARVGRNKGFLRVALDTKLARFPKYRVSSSAGGILVEFIK